MAQVIVREWGKMHRGCISLGNIQCDGCQRSIPCSERYLVTDEEEGVIARFCVDCCLNKDYAHYQQEKGERLLTFFPEPKHVK